jgi:hypothetical protein
MRRRLPVWVKLGPTNFFRQHIARGYQASDLTTSGARVGDEPRDPLAALRVPPTPAQVLEHIHGEVAGLISFAELAGMRAVAQLLEKAREEAERRLAERGGTPPPR